MAAKLKLGTDNNWATKVDKLLAYNDENNNYKPLPFDFDRASTATRVNKDGLIETVGVDEPRIDFLNNTKGHLLLEPERTNSLTYSEDFTGSNWFIQNSASLTPNNVVAPDGTLTASTLQNADGTSISGNVLQKNITLSSDCVTSIYIKSLGSTTVALCSRTANGTQTFTSYNISGNEWKRFDRFINASSSALNQFSIGGTNGDIAVWGAQVEAGSYATSYIPTSGSAVTRTEDFCFINSGLQDILNTNEGTLFVEVEVPRVSSTGSFERITLSDQNASTDRILFDNYGGNWRALMLSTAGNVNKTIVSVTANQRIKVAIAYSSTELRISYDGNTATTTSGSYTPTTTLESFKFSNKDGGNKWQGKIHQAMYFDTALTDAELIALTS
jgi:hypothetical protein